MFLPKTFLHGMQGAISGRAIAGALLGIGSEPFDRRDFAARGLHGQQRARLHRFAIE